MSFFRLWKIFRLWKHFIELFFYYFSQKYLNYTLEGLLYHFRYYYSSRCRSTWKAWHVGDVGKQITCSTVMDALNVTLINTRSASCQRQRERERETDRDSRVLPLLPQYKYLSNLILVWLTSGVNRHWRRSVSWLTLKLWWRKGYLHSSVQNDDVRSPFLSS